MWTVCGEVQDFVYHLIKSIFMRISNLYLSVACVDFILKVNISPAKEEKDGEKSGNTEVEKDADKKVKPQKKTKISEDITATLVINDILDPTEDDVTSSKKK